MCNTLTWNSMWIQLTNESLFLPVLQLTTNHCISLSSRDKWLFPFCCLLVYCCFALVGMKLAGFRMVDRYLFLQEKSLCWFASAEEERVDMHALLPEEQHCVSLARPRISGMCCAQPSGWTAVMQWAAQLWWMWRVIGAAVNSSRQELKL